MISCHTKPLKLGFWLFCIAAFATAVPGGLCSVRAQPLVSVGQCELGEQCLSTRGGSDEAPESKINQFLSEKKLSLAKFHVHGWRWHTMSLVREAGRLHKLASRSSAEDECTPLRQATDYVVGFNMKGLHKIEADLFFPWMRQKLTSIQQNDLADAFGIVMDGLESDRQKVALLGESIQRRVSIVCDESMAPLRRSDAIRGIAEDSAELESCAKSMMTSENSLLVPAIAELVPESEQKSFNKKVLRKLGILDSRLHLVHMHEAVWESNIAQEKQLFEQSIPSIPQRMIPRWKRNLYLPQTSVLE